MKVTLTPSPAPGQSNFLGGTLTLSSPKPLLMPNDYLNVQISGAPPNRNGIGVIMPWAGAQLLYLGVIGADGTLDEWVEAPASLPPSGETITSVILYGNALPSGGQNPFGVSQKCTYGVAAPPITPSAKNFASFVALVTGGWNPPYEMVVNPYDVSPTGCWDLMATWMTSNPGALQAAGAAQGSGPVAVGMPYGPGGGVAVSQGTAQNLATLLGGTVVMKVPPSSDFALPYADPFAQIVNGEPVMSAVAYIDGVMVPIGPNGEEMAGEALAANIALATLDRQVGIEQALLSCFKPMAV